MPIQTDEELERLPRESTRPSDPRDRRIREEALRRMNEEPQTDPAEIEYLEDLAQRLATWR